jgi:uncharacterized protein YyaL (SSP411 family)
MDAPLPAEDAAVLERRVFETFDASTGCFGGAPAFPHAAPIRLALAVCRRDGDGRMRDVAVTALDGMGWGGLYDETEGGFFRAARGPGWQHVDLEKLLDVNAALLSVYVEAFETLGLARYRERAEGVIRYAQTVLADAAEGGWSASQRADEGYYAADDPVSRARSAAPTVDPAQYADWNAAMASAALSAARVFADDWLRDFAIKSLERLSLRCYRPGAGMAHYVEPGQEIRGLLDDQIAMIAAHLDAYETTGNIVYEMMAEELAHYAVRVLWDEDSGGFLDRTAAETADDVGLLRRRLKPFVVNCEAARALSRLAAASGDSEFARRADRTLAAMARVAPAQGPQAAHYLLALREPHLR